jgi:RNA polymerase sigma factor for flagellar operon FliA
MKPMHKDQPKGRLFQSHKRDPAGEESITKYLPLVRFVAEKIHRRLPPGVDLESLVHAGVVGLLEALDRFDPKRGVEFEAFARYRIQGEVMQCLRSLDWVSRSVRSWGRKIESVRGKLVGRLVREPNAEEMAKELDIPLETYFRLDQQVNDATLLSIEDLSIASEAAWERTQEKYTADSFLDPLRFVEGKDLVEKLAVAVNGLPERERRLITLYYQEELTLREIGEVFHLSEGRISQIFAQAVGRLREALGITVKSKNNSVAKRSTDLRKVEEWSHQPAAEPIIQRRWNRRRMSVSYRYRNNFEKDGSLTIAEAELSNALAE